MLRTLWQFRFFVLTSVRGELKARFARSYLGALWFILQPLANAIIFAVVLSEVLGARLPQGGGRADYAIYVLSGMAAWGFFTEIMNRSLTIFIDNASVMKKIAFPRLCLPFIVLGTALVNHGMVLIASMLIFIVLGHHPSWTWLALPLGMVLIAGLAFSIGLIIGIFNVFSRDFQQVVAILLQIWFWLTPIAYPPGILPPAFSWITAINPMVPLVAIYQRALLQYQWPEPTTLIFPIVVMAGLLPAAFFLFRRAGAELVDVL